MISFLRLYKKRSDISLLFVFNTIQSMLNLLLHQFTIVSGIVCFDLIEIHTGL